MNIKKYLGLSKVEFLATMTDCYNNFFLRYYRKHGRVYTLGFSIEEIKSFMVYYECLYHEKMVFNCYVAEGETENEILGIMTFVSRSDCSEPNDPVSWQELTNIGPAARLTVEFGEVFEQLLLSIGHAFSIDTLRPEVPYNENYFYVPANIIELKLDMSIEDYLGELSSRTRKNFRKLLFGCDDWGTTSPINYKTLRSDIRFLRLKDKFMTHWAKRDTSGLNKLIADFDYLDTVSDLGHQLHIMQIFYKGEVAGYNFSIIEQHPDGDTLYDIICIRDPDIDNVGTVAILKQLSLLMLDHKMNPDKRKIKYYDLLTSAEDSNSYKKSYVNTDIKVPSIMGLKMYYKPPYFVAGKGWVK